MAFLSALTKTLPASPESQHTCKVEMLWGAVQAVPMPGWRGAGRVLAQTPGWIWPEGSERDASFTTAFLKPVPAGLRHVSHYNTMGFPWRVAFTSAIPGAAAGPGSLCFYAEELHPLNFPCTMTALFQTEELLHLRAKSFL